MTDRDNCIFQGGWCLYRSSEVSARTQEALIDFKIELLDEVMVPLDTSAVQQGGSCNDPVCLAPTHRGDADNDR